MCILINFLLCMEKYKKGNRQLLPITENKSWMDGLPGMPHLKDE